MQRGEVWRYAPVTARPQPTLRLVVAAQAFIDSGTPVLVCLHVVEQDDPESLLAPSVAGLGWAVATSIERTLKSRFLEHVGTATADEMDQVSIAIKASLDLP